jgi:transcription-repair coupling factor (superfamily II helicase)
VFFVHNRVETIDAIADHIRRIVPRARSRLATDRCESATSSR